LTFSGTTEQLKYTFVLKPGARPELVRLAYRGAKVVQAAEGHLELSTPLGSFRDERPSAYQEVAGRRKPVPAEYVLDRTSAPDAVYYGIRLGTYDPTKPLILDPAILIYAGYIGGSGWDMGESIAVDSAGNAYVVGSTDSTEHSFPVAVGPDITYSGAATFPGDAFVIKVNAAGTALVYAGYIGGIGTEYGDGVAVDHLGNAYVTGWTSSAFTFPVLVGPDLTFNGAIYDAFVAKVSASGSDLLYAGFYGGNGSDTAHDIAVDDHGSAYITGYTGSRPETLPLGTEPELSAKGDAAFVAKVNPTGSELVYAAYIGGSNLDVGNAIAVDAEGSAYVTGYTGSDEKTFPVRIGPDLTFNGGLHPADAFLVKLSPAGSAVIYGGYIGGAGSERGHDVVVDRSGNAYVTGSTDSDEATFPVIVGPDLTFNGGALLGGGDIGGDAFVAKVNPEGSALAYAGYIGGSSFDHGLGIAIDSSGCAYVSGWTTSTEPTFPALDGPDLTANGAADAFMAKVTPTGSALLYSGFVGGSESDAAFGIAVDNSGNAYITGQTHSTQGFPLLAGPDLSHNGGFADGFVAKVGGALPQAIPMISAGALALLGVALAVTGLLVLGGNLQGR
jgi:hypothetical protein